MYNAMDNMYSHNGVIPVTVKKTRGWQSYDAIYFWYCKPATAWIWDLHSYSWAN